MKKLCEICGKEFVTYPSILNRNHGKFCSRICMGKFESTQVGKNGKNWQGGDIKRICLNCKKGFYVRKAIVRDGNGKFCSRKCHDESYSGIFIGTRGYRMIRIGKKKYRGEHTLIAQKVLGRELKKGELVHHINGIKTDNSNLNLVICENQYHRLLHEKMARLYQKEHFRPEASL